MSVLKRITNYFRPATRYPIGITESTLKTISESAKSSHPNEFLSFLTGKEASEFEDIDQDEGYVINDFYIIPGTESNPSSASVSSINIPVTPNILGTLHTHPSGSQEPSNADLNMFRSKQVNIIMGYPYTLNSWTAYSSAGEPLPGFPIIDT